MTTASNTCICCGSAASETHFEGLLRCRDCSHVWADMRLSDEELKELYSASYFQGAEYSDYELEAPALRRNFAPRLRDLAKRYPKGARLWEIGAAYGFFLKEASEHFDAAGCDISEFAAQYGREKFGLDLEAMDYLDYACETPFDVICLWDVVEHLREPHEYLAKAAKDLRPGGTLALSTGDIGSFMGRIRGRKWRLLHPPTHLHYFTVRSMRMLLERLGLADVEIGYHAFWRSVDAVACRLLAHPPGERTARLYEVLHKAGLLNFAFPLNTFDLMTVYARKN